MTFRNQAFLVAPRVRLNIEIEMEIKEEFCARLESIKSEEESQGDIEPTALSEKYEASSQHPEVIWQTNDDISLSSRCRLCAILDNDMVDVFSSPKTEDILEKISYCLPIMVRTNHVVLEPNYEPYFRLFLERSVTEKEKFFKLLLRPRFDLQPLT